MVFIVLYNHCHHFLIFQAYALIAKGVRFVCTNTTGKNVKSVVLKTQGSGSLKDNIITVFGMTVFSCLEPVNICISESCKVDGFLSKAGQGSGRNMGDRQFFFVNGRPVDMPKVSKLVNEFYKGANSRQYPIAIMSFTIPEKACDVNVTPDKRKIFLSDEASILHALREGLQQIYSPSNACYSVNKVEAHSKEANSSELCSPHDKFPMVVEQLSPDGSFAEVIEDVAKGATPLINVEDSQGPTHKLKGSNKNTNGKSMEKDFILRGHGTKRADNSRQLADLLRNFTADQITSSPSRAAVKGIAVNTDSCCHSSRVQSSLNKFVTVNKRKHENISTALSEMPVLRNQTISCHLKNSDSERQSAVLRSPANHDQIENSAVMSENEPSKYLRTDEILSKTGNPLPSGGHLDDGVPVKVCMSILCLHHFSLL